MWQVPVRSSADFKVTTGHPKAYRSLKLLHHNHPFHQKSITEENIDT